MSSNSGWKIFVGGTLIGTAYFQHLNQPWFICNFEPIHTFEVYKPNFDEYAEAVNNTASKNIDIGELYELKIASLNLSLQPFGNISQGEVYVAQIYDGKEAWIRPL